MELQFLGAAGTVTGSKTLLKAGELCLLVDCGLYQGLKELRLKNREPLPFPASRLSYVLLTHAHLDHSGYLPLLMRQGFNGKILCTPPTQQLLRILLLDLAHLEAEEARLANRLGFSRHRPALPLFTQADVTAALRRVHVLSEGDWHKIGKGLKVRLRENGHILGSVTAEFSYGGKKVLFSGDLGRRRPLLLRPPKAPPPVDVMVLESTYGDRLHRGRAPELVLAEVVRRTVERGGKVLVPAFAVGRSQDILFLLHKLRKSGALPEVPVYLDSPMAIEVSEVLCRNLEWQKLSRSEMREVFAHTKLLRKHSESEALRRRRKPAIILAGSGMVTGGRILGHLEECLPDPRHTVLLTGFQAAGTRGRLLQDGAPTVKIHGQYVPVRAEIVFLGALSAHADQQEILDWVSRARPRDKIFLNHGEAQSAHALRVILRDLFKIPVEVAIEGEAAEI